MYISGRPWCTVVHCDTHWYHWKSGHVYIHYQITITIYFSQLEAAEKRFETIGLVENTRWLAPEPWFERGRPAVYQLPKVLKILKSDQSTKITLSIYLSSSLSWVSPLVTINSFGKPFWKYSKSPKIFQFSDQKNLRPFKNPQKHQKLSKVIGKVSKSFIFTQKPLFFKINGHIFLVERP